MRKIQLSTSTKWSWHPYFVRIFSKPFKYFFYKQKGEVVYVDGQVLAKPGSGKNIATINKEREGAKQVKLKPNASIALVTSDYTSELEYNYDSDSTPLKRTLKTSRSNSSIIEELNYNTKRLGSLYLNGTFIFKLIFDSRQGYSKLKYKNTCQIFE